MIGSFSACSKDSPFTRRGAATSDSTSPQANDSVSTSIDLGHAGYSVTNLTAEGAVNGTIRFPNAAAPDTSASPIDTAPRPIAPASGSDSTPADSTLPTVEAYDGGASENPVNCDAKPLPRRRAAKKTLINTLAGSVVWIADVKAGKAMPVEKRADLASEDCLLDPRVQAVVVGTTINVENDDKMLHKLVFTKLGTHDTLTVTPFFNAGQIVATERLAKTTGIVEVRCAQHPLTRAYVAVFDHPYFAVTDRNGTFKIDSLPPGTYKMMVWREGMVKPVEQQIQIAAGGMAKADLTLK